MATPEQVAALCWRKKKSGIEILLITSRETRRWVIPKGWPMEGLKNYNAARREAFEEAGVEGHVRRKPIGTYRYHKRGGGSPTAIAVTVYSLEVKQQRRSWPEMKERKRAWFTALEAQHLVQEAELKRLFRRIEKRQRV